MFLPQPESRHCSTRFSQPTRLLKSNGDHSEDIRLPAYLRYQITQFKCGTCAGHMFRLCLSMSTQIFLPASYGCQIPTHSYQRGKTIWFVNIYLTTIQFDLMKTPHLVACLLILKGTSFTALETDRVKMSFQNTTTITGAMDRKQEQEIPRSSHKPPLLPRLPLQKSIH